MDRSLFKAKFLLPFNRDPNLRVYYCSHDDEGPPNFSPNHDVSLKRAMFALCLNLTKPSPRVDYCNLAHLAAGASAYMGQ